MVRQPDATVQPAPQDNQLMSKNRVLRLKPQLRLEWRGQDGQNEIEPDHSASLGVINSDKVFGTHRLAATISLGPTDAAQCERADATFAKVGALLYGHRFLRVILTASGFFTFPWAAGSKWRGVRVDRTKHLYRAVRSK